MKINNIILAGIAGTTSFTLFSYLLSVSRKKNYKEPELIGKMVERSSLDVNEKQAQFTGWMIHYLVGVIFASTYESFIRITGRNKPLNDGIKAGIVSGAIAGLVWNSLLNKHPLPPRLPGPGFFVVLVAGHIVFGMTSFWFLDLFRRKK